MKPRYNLFSIFLSLYLLLYPLSSFASVSIPASPSSYVVDQANIVPDNIEMQLNGFLQELEQKTTAQFIVLTIKTLEGDSLEAFSLAVAEKWRLGQKGKDNGLLLLVSLQERKYRFEVGYGLEGILPDSFAGSIGRDYLVPHFRKGEYGKGLYLAALAAADRIASEADVKITGMPKLKTRSRTMERRKPTLLSTVFSILFFIGLIYLFIKNPRLFMLFLMFSMMGGRRRSGWGGGGGFGGGGFGGGGGGGFGGGGASGGW